MKHIIKIKHFFFCLFCFYMLEFLLPNPDLAKPKR